MPKDRGLRLQPIVRGADRHNDERIDVV
jgi:hypothetical protein